MAAEKIVRMEKWFEWKNFLPVAKHQLTAKKSRKTLFLSVSPFKITTFLGAIYLETTKNRESFVYLLD